MDGVVIVVHRNGLPMLRPGTYKEVFYNVVALGRGQRLVADHAAKHLVNRAGLCRHPDGLVAGLAMGARKNVGAASVHVHIFPFWGQASSLLVIVRFLTDRKR